MQSMSNPHDAYKEAAILAFGSMVECGNNPALVKLVEECLGEFIQFLVNPCKRI